MPSYALVVPKDDIVWAFNFQLLILFATTSANCSFSRANRLLTARDYSRVFSSRNIKRGQFFSLHWCFRHANEQNIQLSGKRLGIIIPKKLLKTAVHRNSVKRLCREAFRVKTHQYNNESCDLIIRLTIKLAPNRLWCVYSDIKNDIDNLLDSLLINQKKL